MSQQESKCPVKSVRLRLAEFYHASDPKTMMCSKCHPCKLGMYDAISILELIQAGRGEARHIEQLRRIAADVKDGGMCKKGKDHADIIAALLNEHAAELERHLQGVCVHHECAYLVRYEINGDLCTNCDKCRSVCKATAIEGEKRHPYKTGYLPYRIRQKRCTHCGDCIKVCPENAIFILEEVKAVEAVQV